MNRDEKHPKAVFEGMPFSGVCAVTLVLFVFAPPAAGQRIDLKLTSPPPHERLRDGLEGQGLLAQPDSLPENMPIITRAFWGSSGLFRSIGLAPSTRSAELELRERMLQWHQRMGLLTFAVMTTQIVTGTLVRNNPARYYEDLQPVHKVLGYTTFGVYSLTAGLSLLAPPARRYSTGISSIRIHRFLALIHFTGMMIQPWMGAAASRSIENRDRLVNRHRWVGIITYAAFTGAIITIALPI